MLATLTQLMDRDDMHDGGGHWWAWLIGVVIVAATVVLVVWIVVRMTRPQSNSGPSTSSPRSPAEDLLAERLARGEIDAGEYRERMDALREHG